MIRYMKASEIRPREDRSEEGLPARENKKERRE